MLQGWHINYRKTIKPELGHNRIFSRRIIFGYDSIQIESPGIKENEEKLRLQE